MSTLLKPTPANIIHLWFGEDTPLRREKIRLNYPLWHACRQVSLRFVAPSGSQSPSTYRRSDKMAFAMLVLEELNQTESTLEADYHYK